jgi:hypothetical protein
MVELSVHLQHHALVQVEFGSDDFINHGAAKARIKKFNRSYRLTQTNKFDVR